MNLQLERPSPARFVCFAAATLALSSLTAIGCGNTVTTGSGGSGGASASTTTSSTKASSTSTHTVTHAATTATTDATTTSGGSTFCAGTKVEGTCAQPFFEAVANCLSVLGTCVNQITPTSTTTFNEDVCWATGQQRHTAADGTNHTTVSTWTANGATCLASNSLYENGTYTANGATLVYDEMSGALSCPDGTSANIGTPQGDLCPDVAVILSNQCNQGTCP
jgi:hypothetical protein